MKLEYQVSEADFMSAYESFWRHKRVGTKWNLICGAAGVVCGLFVGPWLGYAMIVIGQMLILGVILRGILHRKAFKDNPKHSGSISASFEESGVAAKTEVGESRLEWAFFLEALETDSSFLLTFSKRAFSIIPKRAFGSEGESDEFRELIVEKIGAVKRIH